MKNFDSQPTQIAQWRSLVLEAQAVCGYEFEEPIENYLVLTLDGFTRNKDIGSIVLAIDYLAALHVERTASGRQLRSVGDHCLILSGLFPERALKKNVSLNYFVGLGKQAYEIVAFSDLTTLDTELFLKLSNNFVGLMDVLYAMRNIHRH